MRLKKHDNTKGNNMKGEVLVTMEEVVVNYPDVYNWFIKTLRESNSIYRNKNEFEIEWYIQWGSFIKKPKTEEERIESNERYLNKPNMVFKERLEYEFSILKMNVHMKAGNFELIDRLKKNSRISDSIKKLIEETTKLTMRVEQKMLKETGEYNEKVDKSIPPLDIDYIGMETITGLLGEDYVDNSSITMDSDNTDSTLRPEDMNWDNVSSSSYSNMKDIFSTVPGFEEVTTTPLDVDSVLDKIYEVGWDKLTDREKDFLKKQSL